MFKFCVAADEIELMLCFSSLAMNDVAKKADTWNQVNLTYENDGERS